MRTRAALLVPLLLLAGCARQAAPDAQEPDRAAGARRIEADVRFLADDLLEGREAGTRGYELAARYVAARFAALGLEPAGEDGGWYQSVPMRSGTRLADGARLELVRDTGVESLTLHDDFLPGIDFGDGRFALTAPLVFVGQAVVAPEFERDDFAGVDVKGKIAVLAQGAPESFPNDPRAFYSSFREKLTALAERDAIGALLLRTPEDEARYPWADSVANWQRPSMRLLDAEGHPIDAFETVPTLSLSLEGTRKLFAGTAHDADEVFALLKQGRARAFDLPGTALIAGAAKLAPVESRNVVARLPGVDDKLAAEHVVFTAHLDHIGIGAPVDGDRIYNGALDNALGVGVMLEAAHLAAQAPERPRRSLLFVAVTAEEKGLLGAEYFAGQPTVDGPLVANINMDMPVILSAQADVIPFGIEHTTLKAPVEAAAKELGLTLSPDPMPAEVVFIRSDQFAFIRRGVPAVYLDGGVVSSEDGVDGAQQLEDFLRTHYHRPSDEVDLPIHYPSAARLALLNARVGLAVANAKRRPAWNEDDFFGERFAR